MAEQEKKTTEKKTDKKKKNFFKNLLIEFKKITWPDKTDMLKQSVAVVAISIVMGVIIAVIDYVAQLGVNFLTSL